MLSTTWPTKKNKAPSKLRVFFQPIEVFPRFIVPKYKAYVFSKSQLWIDVKWPMISWLKTFFSLQERTGQKTWRKGQFLWCFWKSPVLILITRQPAAYLIVTHLVRKTFQQFVDDSWRLCSYKRSTGTFGLVFFAQKMRRIDAWMTLPLISMGSR